ncbi:hypothetical protein J5N97_014303 [Dioscorea zingiberensis]|uniref:LOB domain-containing protein n=1 Tax=Dioscorea zingiberensis TaxID=325984 RepID=A0A9D5HJI4_9LILI|nr:hypothetical protein J5N97_014303 [Dioscorea zingiberensis]
MQPLVMDMSLYTVSHPGTASPSSSILRVRGLSDGFTVYHPLPDFGDRCDREASQHCLRLRHGSVAGAAVSPAEDLPSALIRHVSRAQALAADVDRTFCCLDGRGEKHQARGKAMQRGHRATLKLQDDDNPQGIRTHESPPPSPARAPCAACSFLRRECLPWCIFAPYFPPDHKDKFLTMHRVYGARNIAKRLATIPLEKRPGEVASLFSHACVRIQHPFYTISMPTKSQLELRIQELQSELKELKKKLGISTNELAPVVQQQQQHASNNHPGLISVSEEPNEENPFSLTSIDHQHQGQNKTGDAKSFWD